MPLLDVSEILYDPDFCEELTVIRRKQIVGDDGIASYVETILNPTGVVQAGSPAATKRSAESQVAKNSITVYSTIPLLDPSKGFDADIILWQGDRYMVRKSYNWSNYGAGFMVAECELLPLVESV